MVARRYRSLTAAICSACARLRLKARSVGSPRTTSAKWFARRDSACQRSCVRRSVYRPMSHMKTGTSGSVTSMTPAEVRSIAATRESTATGTIAARMTWGRYRANVVSSASTPATATVATSVLSVPSRAAGLPVSRRWTTSSRSRERIRPAARRPITSNPHTVDARVTTTAASNASGNATWPSDAPANERAATRASRTAWARTSSAATSPSSASAASAARASRARRSRRGSIPLKPTRSPRPRPRGAQCTAFAQLATSSRCSWSRIVMKPTIRLSSSCFVSIRPGSSSGGTVAPPESASCLRAPAKRVSHSRPPAASASWSRSSSTRSRPSGVRSATALARYSVW